MLSPRLLPNLFIAGFTKCGTSSLHHWLEHHNAVQGGVRKELEFLYDKESHFFRHDCNYHQQGLDGYTQLFRKIGSTQVLMDSTPAYAYHETALQVIRDLPTNPLCVFVVRNPVDQIISTYHYFANNKLYIPRGIKVIDFLQMAISGKNKDFFKQDHLRNVIEYAHFPHWLQKWENAVGKERMLVFTMSDLLRNPGLVIKPILDYFSIDFASAYANYDFPADNETYYVRSRSLQRINSLMRSLMPRGALYRFARQTYRRINTTREKPTISAEEADLRRKISEIYSDDASYLQPFLYAKPSEL